MKNKFRNSYCSRRHFLNAGSFSLGSLALAWLLREDGLLAAPIKPPMGPQKFDLTPKVPPLVPKARAMISLFMVPERTALFLDAGVAGETRFSEFQQPYSGQPKAYATEFAPRHNKKGNILFAAGNVSTLHGREVIDLDPNSPRRGGGIFPPTTVIWRHDPSLVP